MISLASVKKALLPHVKIVGSCKELSRLGQGENNVSFLLVSDKGKFVVRVGFKSNLDKNMRREYLLLRRFRDDAIPRVLVFDGSKEHIPYVFEVLEYRDGKTTMRWTKNHLRSVAKVVAHLHKSQVVSGCGNHARKKKFSLLKDLQTWMRTYKKEFEDEELRRIYISIQSELRAKESLFTSLASFTFVHGDVCADNVLFHKGKVALIDWEWSSYGDPAQDLGKSFFLGGTIAPWYVGLSLEQVCFFVREYQRYRKDKTLLDRVLLWHLASSFGDMVFFKWKINNYDKATASHPKAFYQRVYNEMFSYFKKRYG